MAWFWFIVSVILLLALISVASHAAKVQGRVLTKEDLDEDDEFEVVDPPANFLFFRGKKREKKCAPYVIAMPEKLKPGDIFFVKVTEEGRVITVPRIPSS